MVIRAQNRDKYIYWFFPVCSLFVHVPQTKLRKQRPISSTQRPLYGYIVKTIKEFISSHPNYVPDVIPDYYDFFQFPTNFTKFFNFPIRQELNIRAIKTLRIKKTVDSFLALKKAHPFCFYLIYYLFIINFYLFFVYWISLLICTYTWLEEFRKQWAFIFGSTFYYMG